MARPFRILSIDGGGIRGIVPAAVLDALEQRAGRPVSDLFDLIAGTSTGSLLALGLALPGADGRARYSAADLLGFYRSEGPRIFRRSYRTVTHWVRGPRYAGRFLREPLERLFGSARLSAARTDVLVPAYDVSRNRPFFFKSHRARAQGGAWRDFPMHVAARASCSAPTYFPHLRVPLPPGTPPRDAEPLGPDDPFLLIDGGVYANNPAACALAEALRAFEAPLADIRILSLGTGEKRTRSFTRSRSWGLLTWAGPILDVVFDGISDAVTYQAEQVVREGHIRIQTPLTSPHRLDDARRASLDAYHALGRRLAQTHADDLDTAIAWSG